MKKIISILLAVMLVVSVAVVSVGAYNNGDGDYTNKNSGSSYNPKDSYTVDDNTPTCEEAIKACNNGQLGDVQHIYFQLPEADPKQDGSDWVNQYNTDSNGVCQVCVYWWSGIAGEASQGWPETGAKCTWVGYRTKLIDAENRIYEATVPADGGTPVVAWNNGVNAGMDKTADIFKFGRQLADANIEGVEPDDLDTIPEGSPNENNMDGCIQIIDYSRYTINPLTQIPAYESNWYIYYGDGCYGKYPTTSANFHSKQENCVNPEHSHIRGDVNSDAVCDILDVLTIQYHLADKELPTGMVYKNYAADVDEDGYVSIIDASRIQRYLAEICNIDGTKPYDKNNKLNPRTK